MAIESKLNTLLPQDERQLLYAKFSKLDLERTRYTRSADMKCKLIKERTYPWSPKLAQAGGRVSYWKARKQVVKGLLAPIDFEWRLKQFDITDSGSNALDYINEELKKA